MDHHHKVHLRLVMMKESKQVFQRVEFQQAHELVDNPNYFHSNLKDQDCLLNNKYKCLNLQGPRDSSKHRKKVKPIEYIFRLI